MNTNLLPINHTFLVKWEVPAVLKQSLCYRRPTMFSNGYYKHSFLENFEHPATLLTFQLFVIFSLNVTLYYLFKRLKVPTIVLQNVAGILIGYLVRRSPKLRHLFVNDEADDVLQALTTMAHFFFIFSIAVKTDVGTIRKSGRNAWAIGILSVAVPLAVTWLAGNLISSKWHKWGLSGVPPPLSSYSYIQVITQFAVIVTTLIDLGILNSDVGRLASSASLINYCCGIAIQYGLTCNRIRRTFSARAAVKNIFLSTNFLTVTVVLGRPIMKWIVRRTPEGKPVSQGHVQAVMGLLLLVAVVSDAVGLEYRFGPFVLGLVVPAGPPLGSTLSRRLDGLIMGMLMPLLMTYAGFKIKLNLEINYMHILFMCLIILLNFVAKMAAIVLPARLYKMPYRDAFVVCLLLCVKGTLEIGLYAITNSRKQISDAFYAMAVVSFLVIAVAIPFVIGKLYDPSRRYASYQRRDIYHAPLNGDLRMLACIHRQDDALGTIDLLELADLTRASPVSLFVLHLVELVGQATPLFIDHQKHEVKATSSFATQVRHIVNFFNYYKNLNPNRTTVQVFTAVSSPLFMYDDICSLAFNQQSSLILLPFHKKYNKKGQVVLKDLTLRTINRQVLEKAPCSVGVLVDRRKLFSVSMIATKSLYHIAVVFIGGDDDREAVALAKQMAKSPIIQLTIVKLIPENEVETDEWEKILNLELLRNIKHDFKERRNVLIKEEVIRESTQTISILQSMGSKFELILVGCRHRTSAITLGMEQWSECDELGVIGDFLASSDFDGTGSALVVQQHKLPENQKRVPT